MFSVIIPVYNKKPYVKRSIESVLKQTYTFFEIIIVNDNSSDGSLVEIEKFVDTRIKILHRDKPGPGGYAARNLGLKYAKYEWIVFLDADDEWYDIHLDNLAKAIKKLPEIGIVGAGFESVYEDRVVIQKYYSENYHKGLHLITLTDVLKTYLKDQRFGNTSVIAVKKAILNKVGGFPSGKTSKGGDLYTWIKIFAETKGAWSPHVGAKTYHDVLNKVTHNSYFNVDFLKSVTNNVNISSEECLLLKKYINSLIIKDYFRFIIKERRKPFYLTSKVFFTGIFKLIQSMIIDLIPSFMIYRIVLLKRATPIR